jgi:hypothetical protein
MVTQNNQNDKTILNRPTRSQIDDHFKEAMDKYPNFWQYVTDMMTEVPPVIEKCCTEPIVYKYKDWCIFLRSCIIAGYGPKVGTIKTSTSACEGEAIRDFI